MSILHCYVSRPETRPEMRDADFGGPSLAELYSKLYSVTHADDNADTEGCLEITCHTILTLCSRFRDALLDALPEHAVCAASNNKRAVSA